MAKTREEIISNIDDMKQYLKDCYLLAKEWDCAERQIAEINRRINGLGHKGYYAKQPERKREEVGFLGTLFVIILYGGILAILSSLIVAPIVQGLLFPDASIGFVRFVGVIGSFFIVIIWWIVIGMQDKKSADDKFQSEMRDHEQKIEEDERRVQNELARVPKYRELEKIYSQNSSISLNALNRLLDLDIIFPKYRNLVAISQIYEYFMSGRCTELEGPHGAYNLYESEMRQNIIIGQLNTIISQLEEIKQNQYMLYSAISEANARLANIESNTAAAAYNTSVIAANSEIIARYYK